MLLHQVTQYNACMYTFKTHLCFHVYPFAIYTVLTLVSGQNFIRYWYCHTEWTLLTNWQRCSKCIKLYAICRYCNFPVGCGIILIVCCYESKWVTDSGKPNWEKIIIRYLKSLTLAFYFMYTCLLFLTSVVINSKMLLLLFSSLP